jgi:hypothetical protein
MHLCPLTTGTEQHVGRRTLFLISNTGMLVVFCFWTITVALFNTMHYTAAAKATIPAIFLFYTFYDIAYTPLLVAYGLEILPFSLRAKGFTVLVSRTSSITRESND